MYKVLLDGEVGEFKLHPQVWRVAAGNLDTDNTDVTSLNVGLQSRMAHVEMHVDNQLWLDWAVAKGIDERITSYLKWMPQNLHNFDPQHSDVTYACPRTWYFTSKLIKNITKLGVLDRKMLAGVISSGIASEFVTFCEIYEDMVTIPQILKDPANVPVPSSPGTQYAVTGSISHNFTEETAAPLITYLSRFTPEFQVICLRDIVRRDVSNLDNPVVAQWITDNNYLTKE